MQGPICEPRVGRSTRPAALNRICRGSNSQVCKKAAKYSSRTQATPSSTVVTDQAVPEGHKGLHEFLYGDDGLEAHIDTQAQVKLNQAEDRGEVQIPIENYLSDRFTEKRAGSYAVYGKDSCLQYIGFARSVVSALKGHLAAVGEEECYFVRTRLVSNKMMASRDKMQAAADEWIAELPEKPPGNTSKSGLWEAKSMMKQDKSTFEEKKVKLQKAMGEKLSDGAVDQITDSERRDNLRKAMTEGDWSHVIDGQTEETLANNRPSAAVDQIATISPFSRQGLSQAAGTEAEGSEQLTVESADKVLDTVRHYLIADGGNVEVVSADDGIVNLRLQGACGTCASSSATMKMGLEKALKEAFGGQLREVRQVDAVDTSSSVTSVNAHLDMLRPAIKSYGGSVEVISIIDQEATVKYQGPATIAAGVAAAIKGQFPDIVNVKILEL